MECVCVGISFVCSFIGGVGVAPTGYCGPPSVQWEREAQTFFLGVFHGHTLEKNWEGVEDKKKYCDIILLEKKKKKKEKKKKKKKK